MHSDVARLVEAGRISEPVAARLDQLAPGNFCVHKSFGAGKVIEWDLPGKRVVIDFEKSSGQEMGLQFAIQKTEWIDSDDFRAKRIEQLEELRALSKEDPVKLIVHLLESHGGSLTGEAIERELAGAVVPEASFKKWWDSAKKALRESRLAVVPQKRTEAIVLRDKGQSPAAAMLADFEAARDIKGMIKALEAIAADIGAFENDTAALERLLKDIDEGARKAARVQLGQAMQLVAARDEVIGSGKTLELDPAAVRLSDLIATADAEKLADEAGALPAARQRAVYEAFPVAFGDDWVSKVVEVFDRVGARGVTEIARLVQDQSQTPALLDHLRTAIARRSLGADALIWVCRERKSASEEVFCGDVGASILNLLENDHLSDGPRKTSRLQSLLGDDKKLLGDLVSAMDINEARNFSRRLLDCPVFGDLERKSLMARIIKVRPETAELVSGSNQKRQETLLVSWESLEKKKAELDDIIRNKIPQNREDIKIAKSYGDLRENFEYKSAKDMEKYLSHRRNALDKEIHNARGTDFKGSDASKVNIGTIVELEDESGKTTEVTVLGAWDSEPEKKIVSYLSEVGKALVGRAPGETTEVRDEATEVLRTVTVRSVRPFNP
ncbi:MAG: GreA/GreB family elongation factor [Akkermansiaceae bacterium]|nr:GreA/GreB family elongation factor [Akkermansiaceae bacterium]MCP5544934.1 GreA/GreB family elongation factor [Akkermansiaceae bacterium]MCP5547674.1 GreA/GreB family elongation factor [Akkermansiaceae bacterium]